MTSLDPGSVTAQSTPPAPKKLNSALTYILTNFGPLITFYVLQHMMGLKAAIGGSLLFAATEIAIQKKRNQKLTTFFKFSVAVTLVFGALDLSLKTPVFFKFEAGLSNLLFAGFFGASLFKEKSVVQEFAGDNPKLKDRDPRDIAFFFKLFTGVWTVYFIAKAAVYTYINFHANFDDALIARAIIGNVSLGLMIGASVLGGRHLWIALTKMNALPSQRSATTPTQK